MMRTVKLRWGPVNFILGTALLILLLHTVIKFSIKDKDISLKVAPKTGQRHKLSITSQNGESKWKSKEIYIRELLAQTSVSLFDAKSYTRSTKAKIAVTRAIQSFQRILQEFKIDMKSFQKKEVFVSKSTCPEVFRGSTFGYPLFHKGFEAKKCSHGHPIEDLVTVILLIHTVSKERSYERLISSLYRYNKRLSVIIGDFTSVSEPNIQTYDQMTLIQFGQDANPGTALNRLITHVRTPYVLIAQDLTTIDYDANLYRLVREMEQLNASVAGGATRDQYGRWRKGCHQMVYINSTVVMEEGYMASRNECLVCDYIDGPFVTKTKLAQTLKFDEHISWAGFMEDFFLRLQERKADVFVCPDVMFHISYEDKSELPDDWTNFGRKWNLRRITLPSGTTVDIDCPIDYKCILWKGFAVSPCCLEELANMVKFVMESCQEVGALCELQEGTLLGAVKLDKVLPWERDADITFLSSQFSLIESLSDRLKSNGYSLKVSKRPGMKRGKVVGGSVIVSSKHWHLELYGYHTMDSKGEEVPTKVLFNGEWVNAPRNPGLYIRNRYGTDVYAHAEHWMVAGKNSSWVLYDTSEFIPCSQPGFHNCLDKYSTDGNIQFREPIP